MGTLNIGRGNFLTGGLAERIAGDVRQRYTLMPGRFSLAGHILNNPLLQWMRAMEDKYSIWLDMMLPSLHTGSLLPQLFNRLREEMALSPFAYSWFDRDWLRYTRPHGMYLPESGMPEIDLPSLVNGRELPRKYTGADMFSGLTADTLPPGKPEYRMPYTSPAMLLTGEMLRRLEARRTGIFSQPGRRGPTPPGQNVQLPVSETNYPMIFSAPDSTTRPFTGPQDIPPYSGEMPLLNLFPAAQPFSIEQSIFNKYVTSQPGMVPQQRLTGVYTEIPQQPGMTGFPQDTAPAPFSRVQRDVLPGKAAAPSPLAMPYRAEGQYGGYENTAPGEEADAMPLFSDVGWQTPAAENKTEGRSAKGKAGRSGRSFDFVLPGPGSDTGLPLPEPGTDFDLYSLGFNPAAAKGDSPFPALPGVLTGAGFGGPAAALPHAPAAFVQRKPSAPEAQQETQEQSPASQERQESGEGPDVEALAMEIYEILRRRIAIEQERLQGSTR